MKMFLCVISVKFSLMFLHDGFLIHLTKHDRQVWSHNTHSFLNNCLHSFFISVFLVTFGEHGGEKVCRSSCFLYTEIVAPLINFSSWNRSTSSEITHMLLLEGRRLLSTNAPYVGGTWWISERCSFHLLTAEIAWGCWRVPDKQGPLHASPWSTFSVAPWIHHGLWQHAPFWAFYIIMPLLVRAGNDDDDDVVMLDSDAFCWSLMYTGF